MHIEVVRSSQVVGSKFAEMDFIEDDFMWERDLPEPGGEWRYSQDNKCISGIGFGVIGFPWFAVFFDIRIDFL